MLIHLRKLCSQFIHSVRPSVCWHNVVRTTHSKGLRQVQWYLVTEPVCELNRSCLSYSWSSAHFFKILCTPSILQLLHWFKLYLFVEQKSETTNYKPWWKRGKPSWWQFLFILFLFSFPSTHINALLVFLNSPSCKISNVVIASLTDESGKNNDMS